MKKTLVKKIIIFAVIVGVGGFGIMKIRKINEERTIREAEEMSVGALKKKFKDIKSVEFLKTGYNNMTGSFGMYVKMTSTNEQFVEFDYLFITDEPDRIGGWGVVDEENVQKAGKTTSKVSVIYSDGSKGEV